jgi:L-lactate dehydrogenase complex protein LldF
MSIEKVVPTLMDAMFLVRLLCRHCTGQKISSYVSIDTGPKKVNEIDGPEELYIVIVDNGRSEKYNDTLVRDALRCFRCGACLNICPVYSVIGGYPYGWAYSGPMGQVLNPMLLGLDKTQDLYRACTLCGACKEVCPTGVNHPKILRYYRSKDVAGDRSLQAVSRPFSESLGYRLWLKGVTNTFFWKLGARWVRPFVNNAVNGGWWRKRIKALDKWLQIRDLPLLPDKTFRKRWKDLNKE